MSTSADLVNLLKSELRLAGITYAMLATRLGVTESTVKRMFSTAGDLSPSVSIATSFAVVHRLRRDHDHDP